jgi:ArsR family transcriptional regulator
MVPTLRVQVAIRVERPLPRRGLFVIFDEPNMTASNLFGAFAHPTRLRILNLLYEQKELCVCDLCAVLGEPQPKVSRHLATLRSVGLVDVRTEGKWKFHALAQPATALHRRLLRCVGSCLAELDELAADRARLAGLEIRLRCD